MSIRWSRLHAELGLDPGPLNIAHIQRAVDEQLAEHDDLDWKACLPDRSDREEFAKDVAAMANSGGGLLVYGVAEARGVGTAESINAERTDETRSQQLRAWAGTSIEPGVFGLDIDQLADDDHAVVLVQVPRSAQAPHHVRSNGRGGVPVRNGPDTRWMSEPEIERAYSDRFARRTSETKRLDEQIGYVRGRLNLEDDAWLVAVSLGDTGIAPRLLQQDARNVVVRAETTTRSYDPTVRSSPIIEMGDARLNPRAGLRRWVFRPLGDLKSNRVYLEVREDGSTLLAFRLERRLDADESRYEVGARDVEGAVLDFAVLGQEYARTRGDEAPRPYEVQIIRKYPDRPLQVVDAGRYSGGISASHDIVPWSSAVWRFEPVRGDLPGIVDEPTMLLTAQTVAQDVLNQFGIDPTFLVNAHS